MKITIEIDDKEMQDAIFTCVVKDAVKQIEHELWEGERYAYDRKVFVDAIKTGVRSLLKEHIEDISARAAEAASISIERKGIQKLLEQASKQE